MVLMRSICWLLFCVCPSLLWSQGLKTNQYDRFLRQQRLETFPVDIKADEEARMRVSLRAADTSFFLQVSGSGRGTNTVDVGNTLVMRLSSGDSVVAISPDVQSIDYATTPPRYQHEYRLPYAALEALAAGSVTELRKHSAGGFDDFQVERKSSARLAVLAGLFLKEVKTAKLVPPAATGTPPSFPGGAQTLLAFLNRNLRIEAASLMADTLATTVRFSVAPTGEVQELAIAPSATGKVSEELLRVLRRMPRWKPARQNGSAVTATVAHQLVFLRRGERVQVNLL